MKYLDEIKSITLSLLKRETDINERQEATYAKKITVKFTLPENFERIPEMFESAITQMFSDAIEKAPDGIDSLGLWIEVDNTILENAIALGALNAIKEHSIDKSMNAIWEFFKMTLTDE